MKAKLSRIAVLCLVLSLGLALLLWLRALQGPRFLEPGARPDGGPSSSRSALEAPGGFIAEPSGREGLEASPLPPADDGTRIAGIVLGPARQAVPHARLVVRSARGELQTFAGPDGRFEILCDDGEPRDVLALDPEQRLREAVRRGVRPGTTALELELQQAPEVEVLVLSQAGAPIERFALVVLAAERNLPLAFFMESERPGGRAVVGVPAQAYRLEVRANGWLPVRSEVFDADALPACIELRLASAGGLRGRVTAAGEPVGGARITLHAAEDRRATFNGFPVRLQREPEADTESDSEGFFAASVSEPGSYHVLVEAEGHALLELGPLALTPADVREEPVALDAGGRLEVSLHAADPAAVVGVRVAFSRGDGFAFTERTDEHGRIALDLLTPGPWQVERAEADIDPSYGPTQFGVRGAERIPSNCSVHAGETTRIDLWLDEEPEHACRLTGRFVLDGVPASGFLAGLDRDGRVVLDGQPFDEPGLFRLGLDEPGDYRLRLTRDTAEPSERLVLSEPLELREGERHWSLELTTGALEGTLAIGAEPALVFHRWRRGALECLAPLVPDEDGHFRCARVPAGPGAIVRFDPLHFDPLRFDPGRALEEQTPEVLRELTVEPGRTTQVER